MNKNSSVWHYKPWWCQPWSILLTGTSIIGGSWAIGHRVWLSILVAIPVLIWWIYFLVIYPRVFNQE
jgi:hypothetical protein